MMLTTPNPLSADEAATIDMSSDVDPTAPPLIGDFNDVTFSESTGPAASGDVVIDDVRAHKLRTTDPRVIGPYRVLSTFRSSAFARVFLACKITEHGVARPVILKWLPVRDPAFEDFRNALYDEARALSSLNHPNLVSILDTGSDQSGVFIALEYIQGTDLGRIMGTLRSQGRRLPIPMACFVAASVLRGLHHAHTARTRDNVPLGIVHRDVNPPNVLVSNAGHIKLTDFGIVQMNERLQEETEPGHVKGKFSYLAPEYLTENKITFHVDLYGVGVTLFELLTSERCFQEENQLVLMQRIVREGLPLQRLRELGTPPELVEIVRRATHPDPASRYATACEMASALELWMVRARTYVSAALFRNFLARHPLTERGLENELPFM